jgi:uncharacterized membrane protein HdeD (DUF308 family)
MGAVKQKKGQYGTGFSITGSILISLGIIALIYAIGAFKVFLAFQDNLENPDEGEGLEGIMAVFGAILIFSSVGIESLVIAIVIGVVGIILIIVGISLFSVGINKYYSR